MRRRALATLALAILVGGCGYSVHGTLPGDVKTIAVPIFQNLTRQPAVEGLITRAVVEAFSTNGRLRVVSAAEADGTPGARNSIGTAVAGGMVASTFLSIVFIPVLYVVIRTIAPGGSRRTENTAHA